MGILDQAHKDFDYEIVDEFIDHFEVMKDSMQPAILALENEVGYHNRIDELFRIFHNLKSASSYLRFERINRLSAFVENSLEELRKLSPPPERYIDWMLLVSDQFNVWFLDLINNRERFTPIDITLFNDPSVE
ncbi:MAG: Hpt domain-containing protein [Helicobacteraceae bacterium]|jgi:two-component system chemotaxis sensor kinase CheA|nr:Hpt domain-containing protein [Helicobacteraceae bacterium]